MKTIAARGGIRVSDVQGTLGKRVTLTVGGRKKVGRFKVNGAVLEFVEEPRSRRSRKKK